MLHVNSVDRFTNHRFAFGEWKFLAVTYDGTVASDNLKFYVGDGTGLVLDSTHSAGTGNSGGAGGSYIGANANTDRNLNGFIDDLRVYGMFEGAGGVLSSQQVYQVMLQTDTDAEDVSWIPSGDLYVAHGPGDVNTTISSVNRYSVSGGTASFAQNLATNIMVARWMTRGLDDHLLVAERDAYRVLRSADPLGGGGFSEFAKNGATGMNKPRGIAVQPGSGHLYVAEWDSGRVSWYGTDGAYINHFTVTSPHGVGFDGPDTLYVIGSETAYVRRYGWNGSAWVQAWAKTSGLGSNGRGIWVFNGHLYAIVDSSPARVLRLNPANGDILSSWFAGPSRSQALDADANGNLYVSDFDATSLYVHQIGDSGDPVASRRLVSGIASSMVGIVAEMQFGPSVENTAATNVTANAAWLNGAVTATNGTETSAWVYWGLTDGGTNAADWAATNAFGVVGEGPLTHQATGLVEDRVYYFRFAASNEAGVAWASGSSAFITGELTLETVAAVTVEGSDLPGRIRATRPAALTNAPLTVVYTIGGTASNGVDYTALPGSVTIPEGQTTADIVIYSLLDILTEGDETVILTLAPGPFVTGSPSSGTVTIKDRFLPATGGALTLDGAYVVHTFTNSGSFTATGELTAEVLVVAGGGGGGGGAGGGGGGGAGGVVYTSAHMIAVGTNAVTVGGGGAGTSSTGGTGTNSAFGALVADGGGGGGPHQGTGLAGGSGGGSGRDAASTTKYGLGVDGQGYRGGSTPGSSWASGSGGGGAGGVGGNGSANGSSPDGADGVAATAGTANTGGGGGGKRDGNGANGGSGIVIVRYASGVPFVNADAGASGVTTSSAWLGGELSSTGDAPTSVWVYWGLADCGQDPAAWTGTNAFGEVGVGSLTHQAAGLTADRTYYYRYRAANEAGESWSAARVFITGKVTVEATDSAASKATGDTGTFTITRPATATNESLTVAYAMSGSAVNGTDYTTLSGTVAVAAGQATATVTVTPIYNATPGAREAVLTLQSGAYEVGTPSSGMVTIADIWPAASGETNVWTGTGNWTNAAGWSLLRVPLSGDFVVISNSITVTSAPPTLAAVQSEPPAGLVVTLDIGDVADWQDVHPRHKKPIGDRLALLARKLAYGEADASLESPLPETAVLKDGKVVVRFLHAGNGLQLRGDTVTGFELAGEDGVFHDAEGRLDGVSVVLSAAAVGRPRAVHYAWAGFPAYSLVNGNGLPASPFRMDVK